MQYQRGSPQTQTYDLIHPPGREVLSMKIHDYQGSHPRNLRNDRNVYQNQYITEQISNDPNHVQRHADLNLKMRNPLFHEFHYKKIIEPQYTIPQHKDEMENANTLIKKTNNADSLDIFQQNYLARQKNVDRAKWGGNLMNYDLTQNNNNNNNFKSPQLINASNIYPNQQDYPIEDNQNLRRGSPPPPPSQNYQQYNPQRASAPNIHKMPLLLPPPSSQSQQYLQQQNVAPPSRYQQGSMNGIPDSRQSNSLANLNAKQAQYYSGGNQDDYNQQQQQQQQQQYNQQKMYDQRGGESMFDNPQYQQQLQQQEKQFNQQVSQQEPGMEVYPNQGQQNDYNQNQYQQNNQYGNQQMNDQYQQQQQQQIQRYSQGGNQQINNPYASPDILNDKRMKKIYNPLVQKISAVYEPKFGVNAQWDKYDREQFRNWENKDQHYHNIVRSKNFILDQHADYSTGNHEYGTKKQQYQ